MYSADFGKTWQNLTETAGDDVGIRCCSRRRFGQYGRQHAGICGTVYETEEDMKNGYYDSWDFNVHFVYTTDLFKTAHQRMVMCGNSFEF